MRKKHKKSPRKRMGSPAVRRYAKRRTRRMGAAGGMQKVGAVAIDGVQVGAGLILFGIAKTQLVKALPDTNAHLVNVGLGLAGAIVGSMAPATKSVATGLVGGAIASSVVTAFPAIQMNAANKTAHTTMRRDLTNAERNELQRQIQQAVKAQDKTLTGAEAPVMSTAEPRVINGAWYELQ